jgi:hypothetical protein
MTDTFADRMRFGDSAPLSRWKAWLLEQLSDGVICPCCGQRAQEYKRQINSAMARSLIKLWRATDGNGQFLRISKVLDERGGDFCKLAYWDLIEEERILRPDGGRAGWWRLTPKGRLFVLGELTVPRYAFVYNGHANATDGPEWGIRDALGKNFDYGELMSGAEV